MYGKAVINTVKKLGVAALFLAVTVYASSLYAVEVRNHKNSLFHLEMVGVRSLTPIQQMTNEQLFMAAEVSRSASMPAHLQQANHLWMRSFYRQGSNGTSAMRRFLRKGLSHYNDSAGIIKLKNDDAEKQQVKSELEQSFFRPHSLDVDVRDDRMEFEVEYRF